MVRTRTHVTLALVPGLLWAGGVAVAAEEPAGPMVVVEAPDDPDVRSALTFPSGWRLEAPADEVSPRFVHALGVDERCEVSTRRSDFADLATDIDDWPLVGVLGLGRGLRSRAVVSR